jgi:aryl-alcohol dehydrogenase-like predicted oxidoreductase
MLIEQRELGRSGLKASLLGLGAGGNSRLGLAAGQSETHAAEVVRAALDMGITLFDTARVYRTEGAVGLGLKGRLRQQVVLSSKSPYLDDNGALLSAQTFAQNIDASLVALGVETIDIYFIHGLTLPHYAASRERFVPVLEQARQTGKIRFFGVTEAFERDTGHAMLEPAVRDNDWDVVMVGYNLLNQSARERVLAAARQHNIGTLGMFAVRRGLIDESLLRVLLKRLAEAGQIAPELALAPDLMQALVLAGVAESFTEAAYRFCAHEPGLSAVLSGTSSVDHLRANLASVQRGPLPREVVAHLGRLFGRVDSISGQVR